MARSLYSKKLQLAGSPKHSMIICQLEHVLSKAKDGKRRSMKCSKANRYAFAGACLILTCLFYEFLLILRHWQPLLLALC